MQDINWQKAMLSKYLALLCKYLALLCKYFDNQVPGEPMQAGGAMLMQGLLRVATEREAWVATVSGSLKRKLLSKRLPWDSLRLGNQVLILQCLALPLRLSQCVSGIKEYRTSLASRLASLFWPPQLDNVVEIRFWECKDNLPPFMEKNPKKSDVFAKTLLLSKSIFTSGVS